MNYYIFYQKDGRPFYKEQTMAVQDTTEQVSKVTKEVFEAYDIDKQQRIFDLKKLLSSTDYVACKIAEGAATREDYAEVLQQRKAYREEINALEADA